jgi:hypothetical protein
MSSSSSRQPWPAVAKKLNAAYALEDYAPAKQALNRFIAN